MKNLYFRYTRRFHDYPSKRLSSDGCSVWILGWSSNRHGSRFHHRTLCCHSSPWKGRHVMTVLDPVRSQRFMEKHFRYNYIVGALGAAGVFGAWRRNVVAGFSACLFFCKSWNSQIRSYLNWLSLSLGWCPEEDVDRWGLGVLPSRCHEEAHVLIR